MIKLERNRCPFCGTFGRLWNSEPEVFFCPNCSSFFSPFGVLIDSDVELDFCF